MTPMTPGDHSEDGAGETEQRWSLAQVLRSIAFRIGVLLALFISTPVFVYLHHANLGEVRATFLRDSMQREGVLIVDALKPFLKDLEHTSVAALQQMVEELYHDHRNVRILYEPVTSSGDDEIIYVASSHEIPPEVERRELADLTASGVLDSANSMCHAENGVKQGFTEVHGQIELLAEVTTYHEGDHCWIILTSYRPDAVPDEAMLDPLMKEEMTFFTEVSVVLVVVIVVVGFLLWDLWSSIWAFGREARNVRKRGSRPGGFSSLTRVPELAAAGREFDRLVAALERSRELMRTAAEGNAHALKNPIAVVEQALEPLRRLVTPDQTGARRSLELMEVALSRLDTLVSAARDLDWQTAASIEPDEERVDLGAILRRILDNYGVLLANRGIEVIDETPRDMIVAGDGELIESILENVVDNAASIVPSDTTVVARARVTPDEVAVTIADEGPGVPEHMIDAIFDRYVSLRPQKKKLDDQVGVSNFGIGLWIARRNAEAMKGTITAKNRTPTGLEITLRLPAWQD